MSSKLTLDIGDPNKHNPPKKTYCGRLHVCLMAAGLMNYIFIKIEHAKQHCGEYNTVPKSFIEVMVHAYPQIVIYMLEEAITMTQALQFGEKAQSDIDQ